MPLFFSTLCLGIYNHYEVSALVSIKDFFSKTFEKILLTDMCVYTVHK